MYYNLFSRIDEANRTKESIISVLHELPPNSPFRKSLISIIAPNYRTQEEIAKEVKLSKSLVSRAVRMKESECLLRTTLYTPNTKRPHKSTTDNLKLAYDLIQELIPLNSAHVRITTDNIKQLYENYLKSLPSEIVLPLGPYYFRRLLREMSVKRVKCIMQCKYCFIFKTQQDLSEKKLLKCLFHQHILSCQKQSYLSDKEELKSNILGKRSLGKAYTKAVMVITDFTLLTPSTTRHQDMIFHVYKSDNHKNLNSRVIHYVGEHEQKNNASFSIGKKE